MTTTTNTKPVAAIAISNGRTKDQLPKYGDAYYLKDGQEFIIMLYNPTPRQVAAKIFINGRAEESMLVLKPGQRVWLERFIDTERKFLFETYEVDDTPEGRGATADNGKIRVEFYNEAEKRNPIVFIEQPVIIQRPVYIPPEPWNVPINPWRYPYQPGIYYCDNTAGSGVYGAQGPSGHAGIPGNVGGAHATMDSVQFSCNVNHVNYSAGDQGLNELLKDSVPQMETGRVEMGQKSNQEFGTCYERFESFWFHAEEFRLMPEKYKPAEKMKVHCTQCRRVQKPGEVFCPQCGTRY